MKALVLVFASNFLYSQVNFLVGDYWIGLFSLGVCVFVVKSYEASHPVQDFIVYNSHTV